MAIRIYEHYSGDEGLEIFFWRHACVVSPWYSDFVNLSNSAVHLSYEALDCGLVISFHFFFSFFFFFGFTFLVS